MENSTTGLKPGSLSARDRIKSYVIRAGRMTAIQKDALARLYPLYGFDWQPGRKLGPSDILNANSKFVLEIGFGMGQATLEIAKTLPDTAFLGIDVHAPGVGKLLSEIEAQNIKNLKLIKHDAVEVLTSMITENSVDGFNIFFPDPWPKKRHHKRRLINKSFVKLLASRLKPGAYIYFVTDWEEYAERAMEVFSEEAGLANPFALWAEKQSWRPVTKFEKRALSDGRAIKELYFIKPPASSSV